MDFLADVWVTCPVCNGHRFNRETLQVRFKGKSISEVLEMDVQEALAHFENIPDIRRKLQTLHDVGLDYLKLARRRQRSPAAKHSELNWHAELGETQHGANVVSTRRTHHRFALCRHPNAAEGAARFGRCRKHRLGGRT